MNTKQFYIFILTFAFFGLTSFISQTSHTVNTNKDTQFDIYINLHGNNVNLVCNSGCLWKELDFSLNKGKSLSVDQLGMVSPGRSAFSSSISLPKFLFEIKKTKKGVHLEGKEGTNWKKLTFSCNTFECKSQLNQNGIINNPVK